MYDKLLFFLAYHIYFYSVLSYLIYNVDGVLLRECLSNPDLNGYSVIILDEAHERSLQTDILMGLLRQLQDRKPLLKLVIMSATLQVDLFTQYFKNPQLVSIPGRQFAVEVLYTTQPEPDYVDAAMLTCLQLHSDEVRDSQCSKIINISEQIKVSAFQMLLFECFSYHLLLIFFSTSYFICHIH